MLLRGGPWEMEVLPARGGRITSLRLDGEELLEQGIGIDDPEASGFVAGGGVGGGEVVGRGGVGEWLPGHGVVGGVVGGWVVEGGEWGQIDVLWLVAGLGERV